MLVAKLNNRYVRIVKTQRSVAFSQQENWILVEHNLDVVPWRRRAEWVPASTRFDWVREFSS